MAEDKDKKVCCGGGRSAIKIMAIIALTAIVALSIVRDRIVNPPQDQVSIIGQGKVAYQPDIANVTLAVQIDKAAKAEDGLNQLNEKINKVVAAIKALGIPAEDIQTQNYSLYPQYDYVDNVSTLSGYNANQQLLIKVRDIKNKADKISKVIAEASKAGANQILGISFDVSNVEILKDEAREKAIKDASGKAGKLAEAADVKLGKVVGWWENIIQAPGVNSYGYYDGKGGGGSGAASPTVSSGSQEIVVEITVNYRVK